MVKKNILIENYSPTWAISFQKLKAIYELHLGDLIIDIQHVGSTSVIGLASKPVLDIDMIIGNRNNTNAVIEKLVLLGYEHKGNLGITDREVFKQKTDKAPFDDSLRSWQKHHLYVCPAESMALKNHLALRDVLRNNPEKIKKYGELKKRLALENPFDMNWYIEQKTPFITSILKEVGFDDASIDNIIEENKVGK